MPERTFELGDSCGNQCSKASLVESLGQKLLNDDDLRLLLGDEIGAIARTVKLLNGVAPLLNHRCESLLALCLRQRAALFDRFVLERVFDEAQSLRALCVMRLHSGNNLLAYERFERPCIGHVFFLNCKFYLSGRINLCHTSLRAVATAHGADIGRYRPILSFFCIPVIPGTPVTSHLEYDLRVSPYNGARMECASRHHCLIYEGAPSRQLPALAAVAHEKLQQNYRCLYLNSPPMVAGMRSYLAAAGVDVSHETARSSLFLSSAQHLAPGEPFDVQRMIDSLKSALDLALDYGFSGLWATGDMSWEFGPTKDFSRLLDYEWRLEEFLQANTQMSGVCQYRADMLPREAMRHGVLAHSSIFVNQTLSLINPRYLHPERYTREAVENFELDQFINKLISQETLN